MRTFSVFVQFLAAILGLVLFIFLIAAIGMSGHRSERSCSYYADWSMRSVPARCISYFEGGQK
jgi:hypothetical protein